MRAFSLTLFLCSEVLAFRHCQMFRSCDKKFHSTVAVRKCVAHRFAKVQMQDRQYDQQAESQSIIDPDAEKGKPFAPKSEFQMLNLAKESIVRAQADGKKRLIVRFLLPREGELFATDENWPGGIMELYRACSPLVRKLIQFLSPTGQSCTTREQRLDESGVDGISLWLSQCSNARDDISAFCQPSSEILDDIRQICASAGPRLVLLVNPQWRETRDVYDELGGRSGLLGRIGNFLGGTSGVRQEISSLGFEDVYLVQQYVVRGDDCQIIRAYPYPNWVVYSTSDDGQSVFLGEQPTRPAYQDIEKMLNERGVASKWAREAGLAKAFEGRVK